MRGVLGDQVDLVASVAKPRSERPIEGADPAASNRMQVPVHQRDTHRVTGRVGVPERHPHCGCSSANRFSRNSPSDSSVCRRNSRESTIAWLIRNCASIPASLTSASTVFWGLFEFNREV
jgi:hypothetical protein